jgi:predicted metal-dependent enzyme (double-stranded beta helix superfamily)
LTQILSRQPQIAGSTTPPPGLQQPNLARLGHFIRDLRDVVAEGPDEAAILAAGEILLKRLIAVDDWLPESHARPHPERYQQYQLYADPKGRFSVVSFVWGPGQATPVHDHTVWGLVGVLRGAETVETYRRDGDGRLLPQGAGLLAAGEVDAVSPRIGDIHRVANGSDGVTVSIHVYGADIGRVERSTYAADGTPKTFISGYADAPRLDIGEAS